MSEGLGTGEVAKEIGHHAEEHEEHEHEHEHEHSERSTLIPIVEAVMLSAVAIIAAWSGYSAAKWGTQSSLTLAKASATRSKANRDYQQALTYVVGDSTTFDAWFTAYLLGKRNETAVAVRRMRPEYRVAFDAWMATHPFTNPNAPAGPAYMPQYKPAGRAQSVAEDALATTQYNQGETDANNADDYVRTTVILASVLFLIGIGSHFPIKGVRIGLISVGSVLLVLAVAEIISLPLPP